MLDLSQRRADIVQELAEGENPRAAGGTGATADGHAPAELVHDLGVVVAPPAEPWRGRARTAVSVVLSVLLHSSAMAAALMLIELRDTGAVSVPSEAVSVEIVSSSVLEALQQKAVKDEAAQAEATASKAGAQAAQASEAASEAAPPETEPDKDAEDDGKVAAADMEIKEAAPKKAEETARAIPKPPSEEPAPVVVPPPPVTQPQAAKDEEAEKEEARARELAEQARREQERKREARRKKEAHKERRQKKAERGGATAKSQAAASGSSGRVSASAGSILTYAARVRARVAGHKPSGAGARGTAVVSFGVTTSGGLGYASVSRSSGSSALDRLAVSAVRGAAPFPQPPAGASPSQLRFTIPFHFQ